MASVLHGSARTTPRVRAELQEAQVSSRTLARQYGIDPKTVLKWRKRTITADAPMGPAKPRSTTLTEAEEAIVVEFRKRTLLPLDDMLGCLKDSIPKLTRSALHRCLVRSGISRIPKDPTNSSKRKTFKNTEIGYVHIDSCELRSSEGKLHMFLAIDRVSKFVYVEFYDSPSKAEGSAFLRGVVKAFPYQIRRVLTDNGVAFTKNASTRYDMLQHPFDRVCDENGIEHRLTKPYHPWTNGQAERMNRTVKEATTKTFHYDTAEILRAHVLAFIAAYNFAKHLKALKWKTPFQTICSAWTANPAVFKINPHHLIPGPYTDRIVMRGTGAVSGVPTAIQSVGGLCAFPTPSTAAIAFRHAITGRQPSQVSSRRLSRPRSRRAGFSTACQESAESAKAIGIPNAKLMYQCWKDGPSEAMNCWIGNP